jgi:hypothetical protein
MQQTQDVRLRTLTALMEANERRCGTIEEATNLLHNLMKMVRKTGKKGTLTLKFEVAVDKNDELALTINCTPTASIPTPDRKKAVIYHDEDTLSFTKTDPRQLELLAEQEAEKREREQELHERGVAQIGRGPAVAAN